MAKSDKDSSEGAPEQNEAPLREKTKTKSENQIRDFIMRGGGEPFGRPYDIDTPSLTERAVNFFKQRSFFGFETFEKPKEQKIPNKFTRYGATRFRGSYKKDEETPKGRS